MSSLTRDNQSLGEKSAEKFFDRLAHITVFLFIISFYLIFNNQALAIIPNALTFFLVILFLVQALQKEMKIPYQVLYPIIFLLFSFSSVLWSVSPDRVVTLFSRTTIACIGGLVIWFELKMGMPYQIVLNACMIGAGLLILFQYINEPILRTQATYTSITGNQNAFAMILSASAFLSFCSPVLRKKKFYILLSIGLLVFAFLYTGSRKVILVLLCLSLFPLFWALRRRNRFLFCLILILFIIFGTVIYLYADEILQMSILQDIEVTRRLAYYLNQGVTIRSSLTAEAIGIWLQHPIIGVGLDQFAVVGSWPGSYSHNNYAEMLANLGMIGFFLYYSFFFSIMKKNFSLIQTQQAKQFSTIILILMLVLDIEMVTYSDRIQWLLLGVSAYLADPLPLTGIGSW